jgi:hypothetical protein
MQIMSAQRPVWLIGLLALTLAGQAFATDLPLKPAPRPAYPVVGPASSPGTAKPAGPDATCLEWTNGCRVCQREAANSEVSCSNVGIACVPKKQECTRR